MNKYLLGEGEKSFLVEVLVRKGNKSFVSPCHITLSENAVNVFSKSLESVGERLVTNLIPIIGSLATQVVSQSEEEVNFELGGGDNLTTSDGHFNYGVLSVNTVEPADYPVLKKYLSTGCYFDGVLNDDGEGFSIFFVED